MRTLDVVMFVVKSICNRFYIKLKNTYNSQYAWSNGAYRSGVVNDVPTHGCPGLMPWNPLQFHFFYQQP